MSKASYIPRMNQDWIRGIVAGAIRDAINSHGPIDGRWVDSAAKRVTSTLKAAIQQHIDREKLSRAALAADPPTEEEET